MGTQNEVFMDTKVFTGIVDGIRGAASDCVLSDRALNSLDAWEGTDAGAAIIDLIKEVYKSSALYRTEASEALPSALNTLRDGMIAVDEELSNSLTVEKVSGGGRIEQKR
ncbi:hypothetical protein [Butyrivibrio sp. M55]|uniref:hypothetical protein n=1 Tax=Butyrivibrio sp. M55 TaxID=1855323 RepID=UPI0008EECB0B|nr:hypothetical protein [Butyrivibrio sp. M55]SFU87714.1 hypothetical protein SAMN05216540_11620 [Butyrivibrio sp. M55]